ncbi:hypothetical protein GOODEAATRI_012848 [Goodea atripinnis]|uniref:Uncharacterized protein n=1 Tax=Goodea atripinnis TaxID=208336 RepID=A0ABV0MRM8_9TELE
MALDLQEMILIPTTSHLTANRPGGSCTILFQTIMANNLTAGILLASVLNYKNTSHNSSLTHFLEPQRASRPYASQCYVLLGKSGVQQRHSDFCCPHHIAPFTKHKEMTKRGLNPGATDNVSQLFHEIGPDVFLFKIF